MTVNYAQVAVKGLEAINNAREGLGFEPLELLPEGRRAHLTECVVAKALEDIGVVHVGSHYALCDEATAAELAVIWGTNWGCTKTPNGTKRCSAQLPWSLMQLIDAFDSGHLPQCDA